MKRQKIETTTTKNVLDLVPGDVIKVGSRYIAVTEIRPRASARPIVGFQCQPIPGRVGRFMPKSTTNYVWRADRYGQIEVHGKVLDDVMEVEVKLTKAQLSLLLCVCPKEEVNLRHRLIAAGAEG